jgi:hypothetical protein
MPQNDRSFGDKATLPPHQIALADVAIGRNARIVGIFDTDMNCEAPALLAWNLS